MNFLVILILSLFFNSYVYAIEKKCLSGEYLVKGHNRSAYVRFDGTAVRASFVKPYCKLLSKASTYALPRFKDGAPEDWPHKTEKEKSWTDAEKERLIEAFEDLPETLFSEKIKGIYRLSKSKDFPNLASNAEGELVFYDSSFDATRNLGRILAHELIHQKFRELTPQERQDYRLVAGWTLEIEPDRMAYWVGRKDGYVAEDGKYSFEEDYANNFEHYLYDSDKLKKTTPRVYEWIQKNHGNDFKLKRLKK